jgi:hypothetical protein
LLFNDFMALYGYERYTKVRGRVREGGGRVEGSGVGMGRLWMIVWSVTLGLRWRWRWRYIQLREQEQDHICIFDFSWGHRFCAS